MARIFNDNQQSQSFHYVKIVGGKFVENAEANAENARKRTDKNGNEKWEIVFSALEGYITEIKFSDSDYGENAEIVFEDKDEKSLLQIQSKSYLFRNFIKRLPLLDPKKQTKLSVWKPKDNDFAQIAVFQDDNSVANAFKEDVEISLNEEKLNEYVITDKPKQKTRGKIKRYSIDYDYIKKESSDKGDSASIKSKESEDEK